MNLVLFNLIFLRIKDFKSIKARFKGKTNKEITYLIMQKTNIWKYDDLISMKFDELCKIFQETKYNTKKKVIKIENEIFERSPEEIEMKNTTAIIHFRKSGINFNNFDEMNVNYQLRLFESVYGIKRFHDIFNTNIKFSYCNNGWNGTKFDKKFISLITDELLLKKFKKSLPHESMEFEKNFINLIQQYKDIKSYFVNHMNVKLFEKRTTKGNCLNPGFKASRLCDFIIKYEVLINLFKK